MPNILREKFFVEFLTVVAHWKSTQDYVTYLVLTERFNIMVYKNVAAYSNS